MKIRELIAILDRREMGRFFRDMKGRVSFVYNEKWRKAANAYPLSLSMPLTLGEHGNSKTDPFLWGLPPDSEKVLDQWGKKFQVSSRNAFGLIAGVGEDCAGAAVRAARPSRRHPGKTASGNRMADAGRHRAAPSFLARGPRRVAQSARHRPVQPRRRAAKNSTAP